MDAPHGWRLQPVAQPVSYYDRMTGQWTSGSFDTAVKSEQPAARRSSGVSASPEPGSLGGLRRGQTIHQLQSDVNRHEQAELRPQESGAAPQPMPTVYQAPPPTDSDEADGGYRRQHDRQFHTQFTPSFMSTPQATSPPYQQPAMQWPPHEHATSTAF